MQKKKQRQEVQPSEAKSNFDEAYYDQSVTELMAQDNLIEASLRRDHYPMLLTTVSQELNLRANETPK